jgi:hypothetical protein
MTIRRWVTALVAALLLGGAAVFLLGRVAQREAERQVDAFFAQLPLGAKGTHGAVSYSVLGDRLAVADVAVTVPSQWLRDLHATRVEVDGLNHGFIGALLSRRWGSADGSWSVSAIALDNFDYEMDGGFHQSAERLALDEPRLEIAATTPVERWSLAQWIAALSVTRGDARNMRVWGDGTAHLGRLDARAASRSFAGLKAGHLASLVDKAVIADVELPAGQKFHVAAIEIRAKDLDLAAMEKIFNPANYGGGQPRDPAFYSIYGGLSASGVEMSLDGTPAAMKLSLDGFALAGLKMRQLPFAPNTLPLKSDAAAGVELLRCFAIDSIELNKLAVALPADKDTTFSLRRVAVKAGTVSQIEHAEILDLAVAVPETSLTLGAAELDGFTLRLPEEFLHLDRSDWTARPSALPRLFFERYRLADLVLRNPAVGEISLKELTSALTGTIDRPVGGTLEMQQLGIDFATLAKLPSARLLAKLGYGKVFFEAHGAASYDVDAKAVELKRLSFGAPEMGTLSMAYRIGNYPWAEATMGTDALLQRMMDMAIERFEFRYDDASLAERLVGLIAAGMGQTAESLRHMAFDVLDQQKKAHAAEPHVLAALDVVRSFVEKPTSLRLVAAPPQPVSIREFEALGVREPEAIMATLGVTLDQP